MNFTISFRNNHKRYFEKVKGKIEIKIPKNGKSTLIINNEKHIVPQISYFSARSNSFGKFTFDILFSKKAKESAIKYFKFFVF